MTQHGHIVASTRPRTNQEEATEGEMAVTRTDTTTGCHGPWWGLRPWWLPVAAPLVLVARFFFVAVRLPGVCALCFHGFAIKRLVFLAYYSFIHHSPSSSTLELDLGLG